MKRTAIYALILGVLIAHGQSPNLEELVKHNNHGIAYLEQFKFKEAAEEFKRVLALRPNFVVGLVNLGIAHFYQQNYENAAENFKRALEIDPEYLPAHYYMGLIYRNQGELDAAIKAFEKVVARDPSDPHANYNLGQTYLKKGDYQKAEAILRKVIASDPINVAAHYNLATALLRLGRTQEGQKEMEIFRRLKAELKLEELPGLQYGEQGKYALAVGEYPEMRALLSGAPKGQSQVRFVEVADKAGISFVHGAKAAAQMFGHPIGASDFSLEAAERGLVCGMGSGAAFGDYDNDGDLDLYVVNCSPDKKGSNVLYRNNGNGTFTDVTAEAGVGYRGLGMGAYWGDYNNDGNLDLFLTNYGQNVLYKNNGNGTFTDVTKEAGIAGWDGWNFAAAFVDYDHDGDLDIFVTRYADLKRPPQKDRFVFPDDFVGQSNLLFRNNGNGKFTEVGQQAKVGGGSLKGASVVCSDFDNRRDVDIFVASQGGPNRLYSNMRDGTFKMSAIGDDGKGLVTLVADYNKDGWMDLFISRIDGGYGLYRNDGRGRLVADEQALPKISIGGHRVWNAAFFDYDNDGNLDLLLVIGTFSGESKGPGLLLFENDGEGRFADVSQKVGLGEFPVRAYRGLTLGDYDNDGDTDIFVAVNGGKPLLLRNDGGNRNNWIKVRLAGKNSNRHGVGTKVEVKAGLLWQKVEIYGGQGYMSQNPYEVIFGLKDKKFADVVRMLWPGGVLQSETNLAAGRTHTISELDRRGTSCPMLYAWDGQRYSFVTDFLGGSAIGYLIAPGIYNYPDTDEYIRVTGDRLKPKDGYYSIKMNDQLEEVMFIDQVKLLAVDHPRDLEVYPNERLMPSPPYPEFKLYTVKGARPPISAFDDRGNNILPLIAHVDRRYPDSFRLLPFKGYAEEHSIILDLGDLRDAKKVILLLNAWIDYADSTANYAASQAGLKLIPPYLQVVDENGKWVTALERMGFPAGLPKTMVVDLTGKFRRKGDFRVRIVTNMRIYWDQILVDTYSDNPPLRISYLKPSRALLSFCGYPREYSPDGRRPLIYDYSRIDGQAPWKSHVGNYTRYGDVTELLMARDDMYVIMRHGDEITIDFDSSSLPELPAGWARTFLLYADGFGKDMDINSARPDTVEPLPFHGMSSYPYPDGERYPDDELHRQYLRKYNTRSIREQYAGIGPAAN